MLALNFMMWWKGNGNGGDGNNETVAMQPVLQKNEAKLAIEQLIREETFSWDECIELTKIIESRVVDSPTNGAKDAMQIELQRPFGSEFVSPRAWGSIAEAGNSSEPFPYSSSKLGAHSYSAYAGQAQSPDIWDIAITKARKWIEEKRMETSSKSNVEPESSEPRRAMLPHVSGNEISSPVDVAKSYMRGQTLWASPSNIRSRTALTTILQPDESPFLTSSKSLKRSFLATGLWDSANESRRVRLKLNNNFPEPPGVGQTDSSAKSLEHETVQNTSVADKREMVSITNDSKSSPIEESTDAAPESVSFHLKQNNDMLEPPAAIQIDLSTKTTEHQTVQSTAVTDKREVYNRQTDSSAKSVEHETLQDTSVADKREKVSITHASKSSLTVDSTDAAGESCSFCLKRINDMVEPPATRKIDASTKTTEHETVQSTSVADKIEVVIRQTDSSAMSVEHETVQSASVADKRAAISIAQDSNSSPTVKSVDAAGESCNFHLMLNNDVPEPPAARQIVSSAKTTGHETVQSISVADKRDLVSINHDSSLPPVNSADAYADLVAKLFATQDEVTPSDGKLADDNTLVTDDVEVLQSPAPVRNTSDSKSHIIALEEADPRSSDAAIERDSHVGKMVKPADIDDRSETNANDSRSHGDDDLQMQNKPANRSDADDHFPSSSPAELNGDRSTNEVVELVKIDQNSVGPSHIMHPASTFEEDCKLPSDASPEVPAIDEASVDGVLSGSEQEKASLVGRRGRPQKSSNRARKKTAVSKHQSRSLSELKSRDGQEVKPVSDEPPNHEHQLGSASIQTVESNFGAARRGATSRNTRRSRVRGK